MINARTTQLPTQMKGRFDFSIIIIIFSKKYCFAQHQTALCYMLYEASSIHILRVCWLFWLKSMFLFIILINHNVHGLFYIWSQKTTINTQFCFKTILFALINGSNFLASLLLIMISFISKRIIYLKKSVYHFQFSEDHFYLSHLIMPIKCSYFYMP